MHDIRRTMTKNTFQIIRMKNITQTRCKEKYYIPFGISKGIGNILKA